MPVFGDDAGEPCHSVTWCQQGWRFNLDHVVDPHGNVISYYYGKETNHYARGGQTTVEGTPYDRGGYLRHADYGQRENQVYATPAPARVAFSYAERCLPSGTVTCAESDLNESTKANWPDLPYDLMCAAATRCTASQVSPTFFTRKRLVKINTEVRQGTGWSPVESWALAHVFYRNDDGSDTLWLKKITHTGHRGGVDLPLPATEFDSIQLANRVDTATYGALTRRRMYTIKNESGGQTAITYESTNCAAGALPAAGTSTKRCFPAIYRPGAAPVLDWFHKYVVAQVLTDDLVGGNDRMMTRYEYGGDAAWRKFEPDGFAKDDDLTWADWRGYGQVTVRAGDYANQWTRTDHRFLRGLSEGVRPDGSKPAVTVTDSAGTTYTDANELAGHEYETTAYNGADVISRSIAQPWLKITRTQTEDWGSLKASMVRTAVTREFTRLFPDTPAGQPRWRESRSSGTFDEVWGRSTSMDDEGDTGVPGDEKCVTTDYVDNPGKYLYAFPSHTRTVAVRCGAQVDMAKQLIADEVVGYDLKEPGAAPVAGVVTRKDVLDRWNGTGVEHVTTDRTTAIDGYGRPTTVVDPLGKATVTEYTETNGLNTQIKTTNPLTHATTTTYDPAYGQQTASVDPNGARTEMAYDALGRLPKVWLPNRDRTAGASPNLTYGYNVRKDKATVITTSTLSNDGTYRSSYELYDGLLRLRQAQTPADGGWLLTDMLTTGTGQTKRSNEAYLVASGTVGDVPLTVAAGATQAHTTYRYDGADRVVDETYGVAGVTRWNTSTAYYGDRTSVDPPAGDVPTTTVVDARGNITELWQYKGAGPSGPADVTKYGYTATGQQAWMEDALGNRWTNEYDQRGLKTWSVDPDSGKSTYTYDVGGRRTSVTDARQVKVSMKYDALGRVVETWQGEIGTGTKLTASTYDTIKKGLPYYTARITPNGTNYVINAAYDQLGRATSVKYQFSPSAVGATLGQTYTFGTAYNLDGTVQSTTVPAAGGLPQETLVTGYDALVRPTSLRSATSSYVTVPNDTGNKGYDAYNRLTKIELHTGGADKKAWQLWDYEAGTGRLVRSRLTRESPGLNEMDAAYRYDATGNLLSVADTPGAGTRDIQCFTYDNLRRLTEAWATASQATDPCGETPAVGGPAPYHEKWTFDAVGNRRTETVFGTGGAADVERTYTYPAQGADSANQPHIPTAVTQSGAGADRTFEYGADATGNTTCRPNAANGNDCTGTPANHQSLTWDAEGRLASSKPAGGQTTNYLYDAGGNRQVRKEPAATTLYLPGMELKLDTASGQVTGTRHYTFAGKSVAVRTGSASVAFQASDHQGTPTASVNATNGAIVWRRTTPYGSDRGTPPPAWPDQKGFIGGTEDATGLTHLRAREYDPIMGRFIADDPVLIPGDPQSINGFGYANSNPATMKDPSGACILDEENGGCWRPPKTPQGNPCAQKSASQCGPDAIVQPESPVLYTTTFGKHNTVLIVFKDGHAFINGYLLPDGFPGKPEELAAALDGTDLVRAGSAAELLATTAEAVAAICNAVCFNDAGIEWKKKVWADADVYKSLVPKVPHKENWWDRNGSTVLTVVAIAAVVACTGFSGGTATVVCVSLALSSSIGSGADAIYQYSILEHPDSGDRICLGARLLWSAFGARLAPKASMPRGVITSNSGSMEAANKAGENMLIRNGDILGHASCHGGGH